MNINVIREFKMGSETFFGMYDDYDRKDNDILCITDKPLFRHPIINMKLKDDDIFFMALEGKDTMIEKTLESKVPMRAGKFLIPEFCEYIGFTIDDYQKLMPCFDNMDDKHKYEKIILEAYISNNDFTLTQEQRDKAYEEYKRARKEKK